MLWLKKHSKKQKNLKLRVILKYIIINLGFYFLIESWTRFKIAHFQSKG